MKQPVIMRSGTRISLEKPLPNSILAADIAEHLSKQCMYNGAPTTFYSVAQHCVLVASEMARTADALAALYGLLHHADEAVGMFGRETHEKVTCAIHEAFDLDWPAPETIRKSYILAHASVELAETRDLLIGREDRIAELEGYGIKRVTSIVRPLDWDRALRRYVDALRAFAIEASIPQLPVFGDIL